MKEYLGNIIILLILCLIVFSSYKIGYIRGSNHTKWYLKYDHQFQMELCNMKFEYFKNLYIECRDEGEK